MNGELRNEADLIESYRFRAWRQTFTDYTCVWWNFNNKHNKCCNLLVISCNVVVNGGHHETLWIIKAALNIEKAFTTLSS